MVQPTGFVNHRFPNHVCKLHKSLCGTKYALRAWFHNLSSHVIDVGLLDLETDRSLFFQ